jgi:hypothetical protein
LGDREREGCWREGGAVGGRADVRRREGGRQPGKEEKGRERESGAEIRETWRDRAGGQR